MPPLWHFTCGHSIAGIEATGQLRPNRHPLLEEPLVWLTDLDVPFRDALGLTSLTLRCDRTEHRFAVTDPASAVWWLSYVTSRGVPRDVYTDLASAPGAMPRHWWVSTEPVSVIRKEVP